MVNPKEFDVIVVGGGVAGYPSAIRGASLGASVALVECQKLGGTCLNWGCIPTKTLIASIEAMEKAKAGEALGFSCREVAPNWPKMQERKNRVVNQLVQGVEKLLQGNRVSIFYGKGKIRSSQEVVVCLDSGEEIVLRARKGIVIATGSVPLIPSQWPVDGNAILTPDEILGLSSIPESLLIVGGGAIGVEFSRIFSALGSRVILVELMDRILPFLDARIGQMLSLAMKKQGVVIKTGVAVQEMRVQNGKVHTLLTHGETIETEKVLLAIGREANTKALGLASLGIQLNLKGFIQTDLFHQTSVPGIYAVGDVAGRFLLAYTATAEGIRAVEHALGREILPWEPVVPLTIFSRPEVACVGLSESEAQKKGIEVRVGRFFFGANGKALAMDEPEGFVSLIAEASTGQLLGGQVIGPHASDLIAEITLAIQLKATAKAVANTLHSHPTLSEAIMECAHDVDGNAIHKVRR